MRERATAFTIIFFVMMIVISSHHSKAIRNISPAKRELLEAIETLVGVDTNRPEIFIGKGTAPFEKLLPFLEGNFLKVSEQDRSRLKGITCTKGLVFFCFNGKKQAPYIDKDGFKVIPGGPEDPQDEYLVVTTIGELRRSAAGKEK